MTNRTRAKRGSPTDSAPAPYMTAAYQAFQQLVPVADDYATRPIEEGFNWAECLAGIGSGHWYLVVFRSVRRATADLETLTAYDDRAFEEARAAASLLFYFKGVLSPSRTCLSFCVWADRRAAQQASALPLHRAAMRIVGEMYDSYQLERYTITKIAGRRGPVIVPVPDGSSAYTGE